MIWKWHLIVIDLIGAVADLSTNNFIEIRDEWVLTFFGGDWSTFNDDTKHHTPPVFTRGLAVIAQCYRSTYPSHVVLGADSFKVMNKSLCMYSLMGDWCVCPKRMRKKAVAKVATTLTKMMGSADTVTGQSLEQILQGATALYIQGIIRVRGQPSDQPTTSTGNSEVTSIQPVLGRSGGTTTTKPCTSTAWRTVTVVEDRDQKPRTARRTVTVVEDPRR